MVARLQEVDSTLIRKIKRHQGLLATIVHDQNQREVADSNRLQSTLEEEEEHESIEGTNKGKDTRRLGKDDEWVKTL
ncbi:hypothetical protein Tco_1050100 [Tanacetum coccineum]